MENYNSILIIFTYSKKVLGIDEPGAIVKLVVQDIETGERTIKHELMKSVKAAKELLEYFKKEAYCWDVHPAPKMNRFKLKVMDAASGKEVRELILNDANGYLPGDRVTSLFITDSLAEKIKNMEG